MKLSEIVANLDKTDEDWTIFADRSAPVGPDTPAEVAAAEGEGPEGLQYFLEVYLAKEAVEVWGQWRDGRKPSLAQACKAVIWYAEHDAYMPLEADLGKAR
jgi:hypothetical protein